MINELIEREASMPWTIVIKMENNGDLISYFIGLISYRNKANNKQRIVLSDDQVNRIVKIMEEK